MKRQTVVDMVLTAYTLNECFLAEEALTRWMDTHPQDLGMYGLAGQLGIVKNAALERQLQGPISTVPAPSLAPTGR